MNPLQCWIGHGRKYSVSDIAPLMRRSALKTQHRRLRGVLAGKVNLTAPEMFRLMKHMGPDFADDVLRPYGLGGVIRLAGEASDVEVMEGMTDAHKAYWEYQNAPGNGAEHRLRKKIAAAMTRARQWLHKPRLRRAA